MSRLSTKTPRALAVPSALWELAEHDPDALHAPLECGNPAALLDSIHELRAVNRGEPENNQEQRDEHRVTSLTSEVRKLPSPGQWN